MCIVGGLIGGVWQPSAVRAQTSPSVVKAIPAPPLPVWPFRTNTLPAVRDVPEAFQPFVPDVATQVLFNPARGVLNRQRFVYGSYNPGAVRLPSQVTGLSDAPPDFVAMTRLGSARRPWLLWLGHRVSMTDNDLTSTTEEFDQRDDGFIAEHGRREGRNAIENQAAYLRVVRGFPTWWGGAALGFFGAYERARRDDVERRIQRTQQRFENDPVLRLTINDLFLDADLFEDIDRLYVGMEYDAAGPGWDFVTTFSYQKTIFDEGFERLDLSSRTDSLVRFDTGEQVTVEDSRSSSAFLEAASKPNLFRFNSYYQREVRLFTRRDHVFLMVDGQYGYGTYDQTRGESTTQTRIEDGTIIGEIADLPPIFRLHSDIEEWQVYGSLGYVLPHRFDDFFLMTGVQGAFLYRDATDTSDELLTFSLTNPITVGDEITAWHASLTVPVYLNYAVSKAFSLYGGVNVLYTYRNTRSELAQRVSLSVDQITVVKQNNDQLSLRDEFYLGATLRHPRGLAAQIAFNGDLARTSQWSVAVGYQF